MRISSWLALGFATCVTALSAFGYLMGLASFLFAMLVALVGALALIGAIVSIARRRDARSVRTALAVGATVAVWLLAPVDLVGAHLKLAIEKRQYDAAVAELLAGKEPACVAAKTCRIEAHRAMLAFPWDGIIDNWVGVVYDPKGKVESATTQLRGVFGGDLVGCRQLRGAYFLCSFT